MIRPGLVLHLFLLHLSTQKPIFVKLGWRSRRHAYQVLAQAGAFPHVIPWSVKYLLLNPWPRATWDVGKKQPKKDYIQVHPKTSHGRSEIKTVAEVGKRSWAAVLLGFVILIHFLTQHNSGSVNNLNPGPQFKSGQPTQLMVPPARHRHLKIKTNQEFY